MNGNSFDSQANMTPAARKALLLIDFQKGFLREGTESLCPDVQKLVSDPCFDLVVATRFKNRQGSLWSTAIGWNGLLTESDQAFAVSLPTTAVVIDKETYAIPDNALGLLLERLRGHVVFLAGLEADVCVSIIAAQLFDHGIVPYIITTCTASTRGKEHTQHALVTLARIVGASHILGGSDEITTCMGTIS